MKHIRYSVHFSGVFEKRLLMGTLGPEMEEVKRDWRKFHDEELHDLY
jgi:hypothetical protein